MRFKVVIDKLGTPGFGYMYSRGKWLTTLRLMFGFYGVWIFETSRDKV